MSDMNGAQSISDQAKWRDGNREGMLRPRLVGQRITGVQCIGRGALRVELESGEFLIVQTTDAVKTHLHVAIAS